MAVTSATVFKHLNPAGYLTVSQKIWVVKFIMASKICIGLCTFLLVVWKCESNVFCVGELQRTIWAPIGVICFSVLLKIADDSYKIMKKIKLMMRNVFRTNNSLSPHDHQNMIVNPV